MDRRRLIVLVILALGLILILGAVAFFALGDGGGGFSNPFAEEPTPTLVPPTITVEAGQPTPVATAIPDQEFVEVVVSLQTVPRGFRMTAAELTTEIRLREEVGVNVITRVEDALGLYARTDIYQGETLTFESLVRDVTAVGRNEFGPSSLIPPGYVAMSVPMDRLSSVAYSVRSGDFVDVLITFILFEVDEQFQSRLPNDATFFLEQEVETGEPPATEGGTPPTELVPFVYVLSPYGRFERQPDGNIVHVSPSESSRRGVHVSFLIQNARVIQVGPYGVPIPVQLPTPTPNPEENPEGEVGEGEGVQQAPPTATPPPDVVLIALPPQQQLFLKYAVESNSIVDFALRGVNDGELYPVDNVTFEYIIQRFNVDIPPNFTYIINTGEDMFQQIPAGATNPELIVTITPTPEQIGEQQQSTSP
jgi:Flp pilus assembly protein CpaB